MLRLFRKRPARKLGRAGHDAMRRADWETAARLFAEAFRLRPDRADLQIQYAHAVKEMGQTTQALDAYSQAAERDDDGLYHLALLYEREGRRSDAAEALARLLDRNPDHIGGLDSLLSFGMGAYLPLALRERLRAYHRDTMPAAVERMQQAIDHAQALMEERVDGYDAIRPTMVTAPPVFPEEDNPLRVFVDGRDTQPFFLRATLQSLRDNICGHWIAQVVTTPSVANHPVSSLANIDPRIHIFEADHDLTPMDVLADIHVSSGTVFDKQAIAWLTFAFNSTTLSAFQCDWDWLISRWDGADHYFDPQLHGVFDLDRLLATDFPPPMIAARPALLPVGPLDPDERRHALASLAAKSSDIGHIALPLISVSRISARAEMVPAPSNEGEPEAPVWSLIPHNYPPVAARYMLDVASRDGRPALTCGIAHNPAELVRVIIPTRDLAGMLERMVESLFQQADRPDLLRITILDNRSEEKVTYSLLQRLASRTDVSVLSYDAPFNWSHMNNVAVQATDEPLLVFANNDMQMLTQAWDVRLRGQLARPNVGVVGARLLYPDGQLQHGGMLMGLAEGAPVHEGVFAVDCDSAADPKFDHVHAVSAVTGAFMAIARSHFDELGGFDAERFSIAYNDVDLCLSSRATGRIILYDAGIELTHFESRTRGFNDSRNKIAWDQGELRALYQKWNGAISGNPAISPWCSLSRPYDLIRPPTSDFNPIIRPSWHPLGY